MGKHGYQNVRHGLLLFRAYCVCGWKSRRRWNAAQAEADLDLHQYERQGHL